MAPGALFDYKPGVNSRVHQPRESEELLLLAHLFDLEPERCLRKMPGRLTLLTRLAAIAEGDRIVVKRFESGGGREGWREKLLGQRVRSEGRREFEILSDLAAVGIPVPRPIRFVENPAASSLVPRTRGQSAVVMECIEHFDDARTALAKQNSKDRAELARSVLAIVRRLHERGWYHRDLYLQHFLLPSRSELSPVLPVLIDVARARWSRKPLRRWLVKDLAALQLSAPACVTRTERLRFLRGWLEGQGAQEQSAWKRWARAVSAKARRLGAHRPRFEDEEQEVGVEPECTLPGKGERVRRVAEEEARHE